MDTNNSGEIHPNTSHSASTILGLIVFLPLCCLIGFHIGFLAMGLRKVTRLPYILGVILILTGLLLPLWIWYGDRATYYPLIATGFVLMMLTPCWLFMDKDQLLNGSNLEHAAPAHMAIVLSYLLLPAIEKIQKYRERKAEIEAGWLDVLSSWFC